MSNVIDFKSKQEEKQKAKELTQKEADDIETKKAFREILSKELNFD